jgi:hypothetical protein
MLPQMRDAEPRETSFHMIAPGGWFPNPGLRKLYRNLMIWNDQQYIVISFHSCAMFVILL